MSDDVQEVLRLIEAQGDAWQEFKKSHDQRFAALEAGLTEAQKRLNRQMLAGGGTPPAARANGVPPELGGAMRKAFMGDLGEIKGMSVGSDAEGGYLVVPALDDQIRLVRESLSPVSKLAREIILDEGGEILMPFVKGTLDTAWIGESASRPETDALPVGMHRIPLDEHYCCPQVTQKLLDTANFDIGGLLVEQIAHGLARSEGTALVSGTGVVQPRGFASYTTAATSDATRAWGTIQHIPTGASGAFHTTKADPLFDVVAALQPQYRANAVWMMNRATAATIRKLKEASSDQYLWVTGLAAGQPDTLLGHEVVICDDVADIAADSLSVWFGDFRQAYTIVRQPGVKLLRDPFSRKGQVGFFAYERVGGAVVNSEAIKALKFAAA